MENNLLAPPGAGSAADGEFFEVGSIDTVEECETFIWPPTFAPELIAYDIGEHRTWVPPYFDSRSLGRAKGSEPRLIPLPHPGEAIEMTGTVPLCNTYSSGKDGRSRIHRRFKMDGLVFSVIDTPSVDTVTWRVSGCPIYRRDKMFRMGFTPRWESRKITGLFKNFTIEP